MGSKAKRNNKKKKKRFVGLQVRLGARPGSAHLSVKSTLRQVHVPRWCNQVRKCLNYRHPRPGRSVGRLVGWTLLSLSLIFLSHGRLHAVIESSLSSSSSSITARPPAIVLQAIINNSSISFSFRYPSLAP